MLPSRPKAETQPTNTAAASQFIVKNDGRGSYYHFAYPIGGLRPPRQDPVCRGKSETLQGDQNSTASPLSPSRKKVPVVLSIELPTGNEAPLSVSSPKKASPKKVTMTQESLPRTDAPIMPTLRGGRNTQNGGRPADAATTAAFQTSKRYVFIAFTDIHIVSGSRDSNAKHLTLLCPSSDIALQIQCRRRARSENPRS